MQPATPVITTPITARFFTNLSNCPNGCEFFATLPTDIPVLTMTFPALLFNPDPNEGILAHNATGVNNFTTPLTDGVLDSAGNTAGSIAAQGNGVQIYCCPVKRFALAG